MPAATISTADPASISSSNDEQTDRNHRGSRTAPVARCRMEPSMRFAKIVFSVAGVWGIAVLTPMYFLTDTIGRKQPPAITHFEFYFGFISVALAWQFAFFVIASDPARFRLM